MRLRPRRRCSGRRQPADAAAPGWRDFFTDDQLRALIAEGLQQNRDLKLAVLAVAEARAQYGVQRLNACPSCRWTAVIRFPVPSMIRNPKTSLRPC